MDTVSRRPVVIGVFDNRDQAERAIDELRAAGFHRDQLGMALKGEVDVQNAIDRGEEAAEGGTGAVGGAVTGGLAGGLIGAALTGLIPGVGPAIAAGSLAAIIAGAAAGAAVGGLTGILIDMGVTEEEARDYNREFMAGRTIVTVRPDERYPEAEAILSRNGGQNVRTSGTMGAPSNTDETSEVQGTPRMAVRRTDEHDEAGLKYYGGDAEVTTSGEAPGGTSGRTELGRGLSDEPIQRRDRACRWRRRDVSRKRGLGRGDARLQKQVGEPIWVHRRAMGAPRAHLSLRMGAAPEARVRGPTLGGSRARVAPRLGRAGARGNLAAGKGRDSRGLGEPGHGSSHCRRGSGYGPQGCVVVEIDTGGAVEWRRPFRLLLPTASALPLCEQGNTSKAATSLLADPPRARD